MCSRGSSVWAIVAAFPGVAQAPNGCSRDDVLDHAPRDVYGCEHMPTYEYLCAACSHAWEEVQKISEPPVEICPSCHKHEAKRQISGGNFILKGGGWYADLYSSAKPKKDGASEASSTDKSSSSASDGGSKSSSEKSG